MANKFTDAVSDAILPSATMKMVLMTLARFTNNETGVCWPGQTLIAKLSCCSYSAAQRNLDELIKMNIVAITGRHPVKNSTTLFTNEYTLNLEEIQELSLFTEHKCHWMQDPTRHHLQICSRKKCGKVRMVPHVWTKYDDREAEYMARVEELYHQSGAAQRDEERRQAIRHLWS
jgi:Helix-turn-helix domain